MEDQYCKLVKYLNTKAKLHTNLTIQLHKKRPLV